jgi:glucose-6-phosphate isomerase
MANFFAQPDALAFGKGPEALAAEGCPPELIPHRTFMGNRPSLSLLIPKVNTSTHNVV